LNAITDWRNKQNATILMKPTPVELVATVFFALAVIHTFCVKRFVLWAHRYPQGSVRENLLHFLSETEVVFGLWAAALFLGIGVIRGSVSDAVAYNRRPEFY